MPTFDDLVGEALAAPFEGWDFSWLADRWTKSGGLPWSYRTEVARRSAAAGTLLDMGTGGGEQLSRLEPRPARTVATEAWLPNVPVAAARLGPLGIPVIQDEGAPDNMTQHGSSRGRLPFRDGAFALVANRHEAFWAPEVARVLAPGGTFVTQQVDFRAYDDLYGVVGLPTLEQPDSWLPLAEQQVRDAGLTVLDSVRGAERREFADVGAVVYFLHVVGWAIPGYSFETCAPALRAAHETPSMWPLSFRQRHFLVIATK
jgi:SAM-dependent methyltransferase